MEMHKTACSSVHQKQNVQKFVLSMTNVIFVVNEEDPELNLQQPLADLNRKDALFDVRDQIKNNGHHPCYEQYDFKYIQRSIVFLQNVVKNEP